MTSDSRNPYEPTSLTESTETGASIHFCGTIEESDYVALIPSWDLERLLCLVLAVLVGICILLFGPVSVMFAISDGYRAAALGLSCFWLALLASLWFLKRRISSRAIAGRMLKLHPDLLGTARGKFSDLGIQFNDGKRTFWFPPASAARSAIQSKGVRLEMDGIRYRYLALTERLFEDYDFALAKRLHLHWTAQSGFQDSSENSHLVEVWEDACARPIDAVAFEGEVTLEPATGAALPWQSNFPSVLGYSALLTVVIFLRNSLSSLSFLLGVIAASYCLTQSLLLCFRSPSISAPTSWYQFGWLTDSHFAICSSQGGVNMPLSDLTELKIQPNEMQLVHQSGIAYTIPRNSVVDATTWQRLKELADEPWIGLQTSLDVQKETNNASEDSCG
ncbi:MAG: hypothetical protein AB8B50_05090 [Pirellulaceae bacterium]